MSLCFIDYNKSFDYGSHEKLWVALKEMGVPQHLIVLMLNVYCRQEAAVRTEYRETEWFPRQRCQTRVHFISLFV